MRLYLYRSTRPRDVSWTQAVVTGVPSLLPPRFMPSFSIFRRNIFDEKSYLISASATHTKQSAFVCQFRTPWRGIYVTVTTTRATIEAPRTALFSEVLEFERAQGTSAPPPKKMICWGEKKYNCALQVVHRMKNPRGPRSTQRRESLA